MTARTGKTAKARRLMIRNGNSLIDTIRNMRQEEEEAKDAQPNYGSRPSPPYYSNAHKFLYSQFLGIVVP